MTRPWVIKWTYWAAILFAATFTSCITYYQKFSSFNRQFEEGQYEEAISTLSETKKDPPQRNLVLHHLHLGTTYCLLGQHETSNRHFEKAYILSEDYRKNYLTEAISLISNPKVKPYKLELHEYLYINYYKAINFARMRQYDKALVECKRMEIRLNELSDENKNENKFGKDAFIHLMMGVLYEANGDLNNAFIAYRNSYKIYTEQYGKQFGISVPDQLKYDLIRTAHMIGFDDEKRQYEKSFNIKYDPSSQRNGDKAIVWNYGLGPIKDEWSLNFVLDRNSGGVLFTSEDNGIVIPFRLTPTQYNESQLGAIKTLRVVFPKYKSRTPYLKDLSITTGNTTYTFDEVENVEKIAFKTLEDRMLREFGNYLLRLATKKAAELAVRQENENLGALVGIANMITEQADTRHWQNLPFNIHYTRSASKEVTIKHNGNNERLKLGEDKIVVFFDQIL